MRRALRSPRSVRWRPEDDFIKDMGVVASVDALNNKFGNSEQRATHGRAERMLKPTEAKKAIEKLEDIVRDGMVLSSAGITNEALQQALGVFGVCHCQVSGDMHGRVWTIGDINLIVFKHTLSTRRHA